MKLRTWPKSGTIAASVGILAMLCTQTSGQQTPGRFWLAGRYDGDRVVVYFSKVQFRSSLSSSGHEITPPIATLFFSPMELPASYVVGFQSGPEAERFAIGDRYDLMLGNGTVATVTLTTLVGCENDEAVGNESYIGALAVAERPDSLLFTNNYYAVRHHHESQGSKGGPILRAEAVTSKYAGLIDSPTRLDMETEMARLLGQRMKAEATGAEQRLAAGAAPALKVQPFQLADGSLRYYVRADWKSSREKALGHPFSLAAWIAPLPTLHILASEKRSTGYGDLGLPDLLNVVDLGDRKTGIIMEIPGDDSRALVLAEYRDGSNIAAMRELHSIRAGE